MLLAFAATALAAAAASACHAWWAPLVIGWDAGALTLVALSWFTITHSDSNETRRRAASNDPGRHTAFVLALISSLFSLFAAIVVMKSVANLSEQEKPLWLALTLAAIALAWLLTHTAYTLRYAHLYYRGSERGLQFPEQEHPCDSDFAYFSFTIGMCFQVSDVVVRSTALRRAVLLHAVLSFVYNTTILALSLNVVLDVLR
jgi:uncharacterized membrane protein